MSSAFSSEGFLVQAGCTSLICLSYVDTDEDNQINDVHPAWTKKPSELKDEDYIAFYHQLYPQTFEEPLFWIHLNVDYPFNLTGILYFPKVKNQMELQRNKIQLYANQVFVTEDVEGIVPEYLTLLHGVIDSPDIPLNVFCDEDLISIELDLIAL